MAKALLVLYRAAYFCALDAVTHIIQSLLLLIKKVFHERAELEGSKSFSNPEWREANGSQTVLDEAEVTWGIMSASVKPS